VLCEVLAKSLTDDGRITEDRSDVRLEQNNIRSLLRSLVVLASHSAGEIGLRDVAVVYDLGPTVHIVRTGKAVRLRIALKLTSNASNRQGARVMSGLVLID